MNINIRVFSNIFFFCTFSVHVFSIWPPEEENIKDEEYDEIHHVIQQASEDEYSGDIIQKLRFWADKGHPGCQLHYGEYLLHKKETRTSYEIISEIIKNR